MKMTINTGESGVSTLCALIILVTDAYDCNALTTTISVNSHTTPSPYTVEDGAGATSFTMEPFIVSTNCLTVTYVCEIIDPNPAPIDLCTF